MSVRPTHVAGSFYEADPQKLATAVRQDLADATANRSVPAQDAVMVLLPHAGHFFCGHVMAQTLVRVRLPQTLFILCPNHTGQGAPLAVWERGHWESPLGPVPVDAALAQDLLARKAGFSADTAAHMREHSLEVILPYLQGYIPNFSMVPISVSSGDFASLERAGTALGECIQAQKMAGNSVGIVVSSDMHHFSSHEETLALDNLALQALLDADPLELAKKITQYNISMCGVRPAIVGLFACKVLQAQKSFLVQHTTSYEKGGDASRVVGYAGMFFITS